MGDLVVLLSQERSPGGEFVFKFHLQFPSWDSVHSKSKRPKRLETLPCYNLLLIDRLMYVFPSLLLCSYVSCFFWCAFCILKPAQGHGLILIGNSSKQCPILLIMAPSVSEKRISQLPKSAFWKMRQFLNLQLRFCLVVE